MEFFTDELRATLAGLGASDVKRVFEKRMTPSDRIRGQNRLLMSCKRRPGGLFAGVFTEEEEKLVHRVETTTTQGSKANKRKKRGNNGEPENNVDNKLKKEKNLEEGLAVKAYDADGRSYNVALKFLTSNTAYRIKGSWSDFLSDNGLLVEGSAGADVVHIEVWAFRSPKLALGKRDHPRGSLGLLFLYRRGGEDAAPEPDEAVEEIIEHEGHGEAAMPEQDDDEDMGGRAQDEAAAVADDDAQMVMADDDVAAGESGAPAAPRSVTRDPRLTRVESFIGRYSLPLLLLNNNDDKDEADVNDDSTAVQCASKGGDQSQTAVC
ncbi:hypothetical protein BS78_02G015600 [Paspalum vaginatum]|nr:hypothetical protein BS78_02G015600 [Paspalum vaginatum]